MTVILALIVWITGWLFTLCKSQNVDLEDVAICDEKSGLIGKSFSFFIGFYFWWIYFITKFIKHIWKFFSQRW